MAGLAAPLIESSEARSILHILLKEGRLTRISPDLVLHRDALDGLLLQLAARQGQRFSVPEFKTWTGVSRKYAIPLLEYLDRRHVTRREGDARVIL
jgi:selenocysteine-specific elongation factor